MLKATSENDRQSWRLRIAENRTPQAIAAGMSFGLAIGLVPKDSLLVMLLLVFVATLPIHQLLACAVALTVTLLSPWTFAWIHPLGERILSFPAAGNILGAIYKFPLIPWLRLENTLVVGGVVCGISAWLPTYLLTLWFAQKTSTNQIPSDIATIASTRLRHRRANRSEERIDSTTLNKNRNEKSRLEPVVDGSGVQANFDGTLAKSVTSTGDQGILTSPHSSKIQIHTNSNSESVLPFNSTSPRNSREEFVGVGAESIDYPPEDIELANLVLQVQETMMEAARASEGRHIADTSSFEDITSVLPNDVSKTATNPSPIADSLQGAGMTILANVGPINQVVPSGIILVESPELPVSNRNTADASLEQTGVPNSIDKFVCNESAKRISVEANSKQNWDANGFRDNQGRQIYNHAGSKEESLRNILKHIHSLRKSKMDAEKTV